MVGQGRDGEIGPPGLEQDEGPEEVHERTELLPTGEDTVARFVVVAEPALVEPRQGVVEPALVVGDPPQGVGGGGPGHGATDLLGGAQAAGGHGLGDVEPGLGEGHHRRGAEQPGPLMGGEAGDGLRPGRLLQPLVELAPGGGQPGQGHAQPGFGDRGLGPGEQVEAHPLGLFALAGDDQDDHELGQQAVTARVLRVDELEGALQELGRRRRRPDGGLLHRPVEPVEGHRVTPALAPDEVLGHRGRRRPGRGQGVADVAVHPDAHRAGDVLIEGLPQQVVAEGEVVAVLAEHGGAQRLPDLGQEVKGRPAEGQRQGGDGERRAQHRRHRQDVEGVPGQEAHPVEHDRLEGDGEGNRLDLGRRPCGVHRTVGHQRAHQLGDEERVAAGVGHLASQTGPGLAAQEASDELDHLLRGEGNQAQGRGAPFGQGLQEAGQLR